MASPISMPAVPGVADEAARPVGRALANERLQERFTRALELPPRENDRSALPQGPQRDWVAIPPAGAHLAPAPAQRGSHEEVAALLQRFCSQLYTSEGSGNLQPRVLLELDAALKGAAVEVAREGAVLRVRLRARTDAAHQLMLSEQETLGNALAKQGGRQVIVEVIRDQGERDGRSA